MTRTQKIVLFAIFIVIFCIIFMNPLMIRLDLVREPTQCTWGVWRSFDMPELAAKWQEQLKSVGLEAADISAYGVGEPIECTGRTLIGYTYSEIPPAAVDTGVYATLQVNSIADDAALGEIIVKILAALDPTAPYDELEQASIHLTFTSNQQNKSIEFYVGTVANLLKQGLTNAELFQTLDGRYIPATVTPVPSE